MKWVVCIKNASFEASLGAGNIYNIEDDQKAHALGMVRVVDELGEGYLHPQEMFAPITIQNALKGQLLTS